MAELIQISGSLKPNAAIPLDSRGVVDTFNDIANISNPNIGLLIYVKAIDTHYKVVSISSKSNAIGFTEYYIDTTKDIVEVLQKGEKGDTGPQGPQGERGLQGEKGSDGSSVTILGSVGSKEELVNKYSPSLTRGDGYLINGYLWVFQGSEEPASGEYFYDSVNKVYWLNVGEIKGPKGDKGDKGDQGVSIEGPKGEDGKTSYIHIRYSNSSTGANMNESAGRYIGIQIEYTGTPSKDPNDYKPWVEIKGAQGPQGIAGDKGYVHIAYADSADGKDNFTILAPEGRKYIGVYSDNIADDSTNPEDYKWSKLTGDAGINYTYRIVYAVGGLGDSAPSYSPSSKNPGTSWSSAFPEYDPYSEVVWAIDAIFNVETNNLSGSWGNLRLVTGVPGAVGTAPNYSTTVFALTSDVPTPPAVGVYPTTPGTSIGSAGVTANWVDYPDTPETDNLRWWACVGKVNGVTELVTEWGQPHLCFGQDGEDGDAKDGKFLEWRFFNSEDKPTIVDKTARIPQTKVNGVNTNWGTAQNLPTVAENEFMWASTCYVTANDTLDGNWSEPWKVSGERGPQGIQGIQGPIGEQGIQGTAGIPGVTYEERYMLGTENAPKNAWNSTLAGKREPDGWTTSIPKTTEEYLYIWCIKARTYKATAESEEWLLEPNATWEGPFRLSGLNGLGGEQGARGQLVYPAGVYDVNKLYETTENSAPYVYDPKGSAFYVLNKQMQWVGEKADNIDYPQGVVDQNGQTPYDNSITSYPVWIPFEMFDAVYTQIGIIANGLIGSSVFNGDFVFSQQGKDNKGKYSSAYHNFCLYDKTDPYASQNIFYPNICFNYRTGEGWLAGSKIKWDADGNVTFDSSVKMSWNNISDGNDILQEAINVENAALKIEIINDINAYKASNNAAVEELQNKQAIANAAIKNAQADINAANRVIASNKSDIDLQIAAVEQSIETSKSALESKYDARLADLSLDIDASERALTDAKAELESAIAAGDEAAIKAAQDKVDALNDLIEALEIKQTQLENDLNSKTTAINALYIRLGNIENGTTKVGLTTQDVNSLIQTAFIDGTYIESDSVTTPNVFTSNILALVAKFGTVDAARITGDTIQGHTIQSSTSIDNSGTNDAGIVTNPTWKLNNDGTGYFARRNISWDLDGNIQIGSIKDPEGNYPTVNIGCAWITTSDGWIKTPSNSAAFGPDGQGRLGKEGEGLSWDKSGNVTINSQLKYNFQVIYTNTADTNETAPTSFSLKISDTNKYLIKDNPKSSRIIDEEATDKFSLYLNWWSSEIEEGSIVDVDIINGSSDSVLLKGVTNRYKNAAIYAPFRKTHDYIFPQNNFTLGSVSWDETNSITTNQICLLPGTTLQLQLYKVDNFTYGYIKNIGSFQLLSSINKGTNVTNTNVLCSLAPEHNNMPVNNVNLDSLEDDKMNSHFMVNHYFKFNTDANFKSFLKECKSNSVNLPVFTKPFYFENLDTIGGNLYNVVIGDGSVGIENQVSNLFTDNYDVDYANIKILDNSYGFTWSQISQNPGTLSSLISSTYGINVTNLKVLSLPYIIKLNYYIPEYGKIIKSEPVRLTDTTLSDFTWFRFNNVEEERFLATLFNSTHKLLNVYTYLEFKHIINVQKVGIYEYLNISSYDFTSKSPSTQDIKVVFNDGQYNYGTNIVTSKATWLTVKNNNNGTYTLTVSQNTTGAKRTTTLTMSFTYNGVTYTRDFEVSQAG